MPSNKVNSLIPKQESGITALVAQPTIAKAAESIGINERTLRRWMEDEAFMDAYRRGRREAFTHSVSMAQKYAPAMLNTLASISMDKTAPHSARVAASKAALDYGRQSLELDDMARRIEKLEADAAERATAGQGAFGGPFRGRRRIGDGGPARANEGERAG